MRRLAFAALALTAVLVIRVGWAATVHGTGGPDVLRGTAKADRLFGRGGADRLQGKGGPDLLDGGPGPDVVEGGRGDDRISAEEDGASDRVLCGPGRDVVTAETTDVVDRTCEVVSVQLSRDATPAARDAQHQTAVEPASGSSGRTVVAAYQVGRFSGGGAGAVGVSTTRDAGVTWRSSVLPGLTADFARVADPSVAYDAVHRWWLVASLAADFSRGTSLLVSRSRDGIEWSAPVVAVPSGAGDFDKEWIACDGWSTSRFRGRCYLSYLNLATQRLETRFSTDGGRSWSAPAATAPSTAQSIVNGAIPLARPDGSLVVVFSAFSGVLDPARNSILATRSTDGGLTFGPVARVSPLYEEDVRGMRAPALPAAAVGRTGTLYVAWADCRFRPECANADVVIATSRDGRTWNEPRRVPAVPPREDAPDVFLPGIGVDTSGGADRLAVVYHTLPQPMGCALDECPGVDVWVQRSGDGGATWARPQRLSARGMPLTWIADGDTGAMLGDYVSLSWAGGRAVPVFALASPPVRGELRQEIFATSRLR